MNNAISCPNCRTCRRARSTGRVALLVSVMAIAVAGVGSTYAATGGTFRLGVKNSATSVTTLHNKHGSALKLKAGRGKPALKVNTKARVRRLNADRLDGLNSTAFMLTGGTAADADMLDGLDSSDFARNGDVLEKWHGYAIMVAGHYCPAGTTPYGGLSGTYGAENEVSAGFGSYLYSVRDDSSGLGPRLVRDEDPLVMSACLLP